MRSPHTPTGEWAPLPKTREKSLQQRRPSTAKNKLKKKGRITHIDTASILIFVGNEIKQSTEYAHKKETGQ